MADPRKMAKVLRQLKVAQEQRDWFAKEEGKTAHPETRAKMREQRVLSEKLMSKLSAQPGVQEADDAAYRKQRAARPAGKATGEKGGRPSSFADDVDYKKVGAPKEDEDDAHDRETISQVERELKAEKDPAARAVIKEELAELQQMSADRASSKAAEGSSAAAKPAAAKEAGAEQSVETGKRGGRYYMTSGGKKVYVK